MHGFWRFVGFVTLAWVLAGAAGPTVTMAQVAGEPAPAAAPAPAAEPTAPLPLAGKTLSVAVRYVPPFVFWRNNKVTGFSYDLWTELARETGAKTQFQVMATLPQVLDAVKQRQVDLAIYSISITAQRELDYDFSQPMFDSGLQVLVRADAKVQASSLPAMMHSLASGPILNLLGLLALLILVPAHLIWLFERNHHQSEMVAKAYFPGIFKAIWWATCAAGGQQQGYLHSPFGKFISGLSVFVSVLFVAYFTAAITSAMTVNQLKGDIGGPGDLGGRRVAVVAASSAVGVVQTLGGKLTEFPGVSEALGALDAGQVDAVVYDAPVLLYHASHEGLGKVLAVGDMFHRENYGIMFPAGSPLRKPIDEALLKMHETGAYDALYKKWFATEPAGG